MDPSRPTPPDLPARLAAAAALVAAGAWVYYPTAAGLARLWTADPNYSHGFLVPVLAAGLLAYRARTIRTPATEPAPLAGLLALAAAAAARGAGAYFYVTPLDHLSLLLALVGGCLLAGGRGWLAVAWPAVAVLAFMFPLPASVGGPRLTGGLQAVATAASTFALQTLGFVADRDGNVILLPRAELGIVEACSGLRMLMVFCALTAVTAALVPGGWVRKAVLLLSAVPLAVACNVARITAAGVASESLGTDAGYFVFHDLAGWLMVPLAFALLAAELAVLTRLVRPAAPDTRAA